MIIAFCFFAVSCQAGSHSNETEKEKGFSGSQEVKIEIFTYDSLTIPQFFSTLIKNHLSDFYAVDSISYQAFCINENLLPDDETNISNYFTLSSLHRIFTCYSASNCSRGDILNIPYFWHWVTPNPRHEIYFTDTRQLLSKTKPPKEFANYATFADIDRTPYLFLADLFAENPRYYSASCDTFSTFGWCSEREMAFAALTKLLNYESKVVASGNHSWSEVLVKMKDKDGKIQYYKVIVDNTFDRLVFGKMAQSEIAGWKQNLGNSNIEKWYNNKAVSDVPKIKNFVAGKKAMERIELKVVDYLKRSVKTNL
jgi:hypothetical protein